MLSSSRNLFVINVPALRWSPSGVRPNVCRPLFGGRLRRIFMRPLPANLHGQFAGGEESATNGKHVRTGRGSHCRIYAGPIFVNKELFNLSKSIFNYYVNSAKSCDLIQTRGPLSLSKFYRQIKKRPSLLGDAFHADHPISSLNYQLEVSYGGAGALSTEKLWPSGIRV